MEDLVIKGLEKLYHTDTDGSGKGAKEGSLYRVLIIRNRQTDQRMSFVYAEYHTVADATAALAKAQILGDKCTIASKPVEVSFPGLHVFPREDFGGQEMTKKFTFKMPSTGYSHKYHDGRLYASEVTMNAETPREASNPPKVASEGNKQRKSSASDTLENQDKRKKRKAPGTDAPPVLQHWQSKAAELHGGDEKAPTTQYRDRAAERRQQEDEAGANEKIPSFSLKGLKPRTSSSSAGASSYGKGLNMLQNAGWTAGQSLGTGNGTTAPLDQNMYRRGVGLGHEGGNLGDAVEEAQRMTRGDGSRFVEKTKESARERFKKL